MHIIELKIHAFLEEVKKGNYKLSEKDVASWGEDLKDAFKKQFENKKRDYKLYLSAASRPLCILQMEKRYGSDNTNVVRNLIGDVVEDIVLFLLRASGIKIVSQIERVELNIDGHKFNGIIDVILDLGNGPEIYDIKSASDWAFNNKYSKMNFTQFIEEDTFGYAGQIFGYSRAKGIPVGGFIVVSKSSGELIVLAAPKDQERLCNSAIAKIKYNLTNIDKPFKRQYEDVAETFRNKPTGNRILKSVCSMCGFKYRCWSGLQTRASLVGTSKNPALKDYTLIKEK